MCEDPHKAYSIGFRVEGFGVLRCGVQALGFIRDMYYSHYEE